jgi:hypothetical protein
LVGRDPALAISVAHDLALVVRGPVQATFRRTSIDRKEIALRWVVCQLLARDRVQDDLLPIQTDPNYRTDLVEAIDQTLATTPIWVRDPADLPRCLVRVRVVDESQVEQPTIS